MRQFNAIQSNSCLRALSVTWCYHSENMTENVNVCFEVHVEKKLKTLTMNKSESFCYIYFRHRRKKFCYLGAYSHTNSFDQKRVFEILRKK